MRVEDYRAQRYWWLHRCREERAFRRVHFVWSWKGVKEVQKELARLRVAYQPPVQSFSSVMDELKQKLGFRNTMDELRAKMKRK